MWTYVHATYVHVCAWVYVCASWVYGDDDDSARRQWSTNFFLFNFSMSIASPTLTIRPFSSELFISLFRPVKTYECARDRVSRKHQSRLQGSSVLGWVRLVNQLSI